VYVDKIIIFLFYWNLTFVIGSHFKCDVSYSFAAVDKTSSDTARRAVPLR